MLELLAEWKLDHPKFVMVLRGLVAPALLLLTAWFLVQDVLNSLFSSTSLTYASPDIHWWLFFPFALSLAFFIACVQPAQASTTRGSAHWATLAELRSAHLLNSPSAPVVIPQLPAAGGTTAASSVTDVPESLLEIGRWGKYPIALTERQQESHVLIIAPTGKRKSSGFFVPALLQESGHRSLLINDVKGELYQLCAGAMSRYHDIQVYSPTNPTRSSAYNPLAHMKTSKDARDFATNWVTNTGISREAFYNTASVVLITALVLHLIDTEQEPPLFRLADLTIKPLDEIKALLLSSGSTRARNTAAPFLQTVEMNPRLASSVVLGVSNRFSLLIDSPDYRQVTAHNEIHFERMIDGLRPVALFLNVPVSDAKDLRALTSSLIMQQMRYLSKRAEQEPSGRLPRPVAFYLDELVNAGRINGLEEYITYVRKEGVSIIGGTQDFGQLDRVYSPEIRDTFLSNFTTQIVLPGIGEREGDYYSRRLGSMTVETTSRTNRNRGGSNRDGLFSLFVEQATSTTTSEVQRALMLSDEIRTMPTGSFIMISDNVAPVRGMFRTYLERPDLQALISLPIVPAPRSLNNSLPISFSAPTIPNTPQHSTLPPPEHL